MKKKIYYKVKDDMLGQHGGFIEEVELTRKQYKEIQEIDRRKRDFFITDSYHKALLYIQD